jgi:ActR/RegA family two-component response regulator
MTVEPSCPALVIHEDDGFRRTLIATLDQRHFTVTFSTDGDAVIDLLRDRGATFHVILVGLEIGSGKGVKPLRYLGEHPDSHRCGVILLASPDPGLHTFAPWVDETLMKPVDAEYVATRAQVYCSC